jgi:hypothetical protein
MIYFGMLKKKCSHCAKKIERKFNFCPYCGISFKAVNEQEDYGFLGMDDESMPNVREELNLPFGMNRMVESLVKQLEKQMEGMDFEGMEGVPRGVKIRVSAGRPQVNQVIRAEEPRKKVEAFEIPSEERDRRVKLPRVEATSKIRRLADRIVYEIEAPGVKTKKDVSITELASGLEVRVYAKDNCYVKIIPLKVEVIEYHVEKDKLFLELKG